MTCQNLFITYVYVRSVYLISRQLSQKGELSDFKLLTLSVLFRCSSTYVRVRFFLSTHAAHPRRRTETQG